MSEEAEVWGRARELPRDGSAEGVVEGLDLAYTAPAAAGEMAKVPGLQSGIVLMKTPGQGHVRLLQRPDLNCGPRNQA